MEATLRWSETPLFPLPGITQKTSSNVLRFFADWARTSGPSGSRGTESGAKQNVVALADGMSVVFPHYGGWTQ
jgi:hypothetical protein